MADGRAGRSAQTKARATAGRVRRTATTPLWRQIRDDLQSRLDGGEFVDVFPGEKDLSAEYAVSRQTIRQALRDLREQGVVTAARGRRSRLAGATYIEQPIGALYSLFASVEAAGIEQRSVVHNLDIRADAKVSERLGLDASASLLYLARVRLAGGEPLAYDRIWMPAEDTHALLNVDFSHTALYDELASRCGIQLTGGDERISAIVPSEHDRELLAASDNIAMFVIERLGISAARPVEWRVSMVRGDLFSMRAHFDGRTGYQLQLGSKEQAPVSPEARRRRRRTPGTARESRRTGH